MKPTEEQIIKIAEELECGMNCYFNIKIGAIKKILNFNSWDVADEESWQEDIQEIENNYEDYIEFEGMDSHRSFNLMVDFVDEINDLQLKERLVRALNKPKPFRNFKWVIDNSGEYRQQWFDFRKSRYISWVKQQML